MKQILLAIAGILFINMTTFAGIDSSQDFKSLGVKVFKAPKSISSVKSLKDDLAIVYGGEDISRSLSTDTFIA